MNKTEYMLIESHKRVKQFHNVNIIGNNALKEVYSCKHLGVILDPSLNWKLHIDAKKVVRGLFLFRKVRPIVDLCTARMLYFSIIQTHFYLIIAL